MADLSKSNADGASQVISAYINVSKSLLDALQDVPEPRGTMLQTMLNIRLAMAGRFSVDDALAAAATISREELDNTDPNLAIIFLCLWANLAYVNLRLEGLSAIMNRARVFVSSNTPCELLGNIRETESVLASATGNYVLREKLSGECIEIMANSPRRKMAVWDHALLLTRRGRGWEIEEDLRWLEGVCDTAFKYSRIAICRYFNAVEVGDCAEALRTTSQFNADPLIAGMFGSDYQQRRLVLQFMCDEAGLQQPPPALVPAIDMGVFDSTLRALFERRPEEALLCARKDCETLHVTLGFHSFNLIRAELACRHANAARNLLIHRHEVGHRHYFDDFFWCRVHRLEGNHEAATQHFKKLLASVERYGARGRLNFELRLALELNPSDLVSLSQSAARSTVLLPSTPSSGSAPAQRVGVEHLIGRSRSIAALRSLVTRFSELDPPVLITGETGTGKELIARALHEAGPRRTKPFLAVNCGAIPESLLESELFGHSRGAFTGAFRQHRGYFEEAGSGTLFLDEIGEIPPRLQVALLRVLETGEVRPVGGNQAHKFSCRIVAATNADLNNQTDTGQFRKDLFFRLSRLTVEVQPLRERPDDILPLADFFLGENRMRGTRPAMSAALKERLINYSWPGNVRELRHAIERMRLMNSEKDLYDAQDLDIKSERTQPAAPAAPMPAPSPISADMDTPANVQKNQAAGQANGSANARAQEITEFLQNGRTTLRRLQRLRELFQQHRVLTRTEISQITQISPATATQDLKALCEEGFVVKVKPSASPRSHYFSIKT
jgi:DNA-binding NtrC family response regulator